MSDQFEGGVESRAGRPLRDASRFCADRSLRGSNALQVYVLLAARQLIHRRQTEGPRPNKSNPVHFIFCIPFSERVSVRKRVQCPFSPLSVRLSYS
jgi:hypothetical protein